MNTPYTYRVFNTITNQYYYGVRFAKDCHPDDLFVKYFTSSDSVKKLIELYGKDSFTLEIRKIFGIGWRRGRKSWSKKWWNNGIEERNSARKPAGSWIEGRIQ